ncbi:hypothetical protein [Yokenella regensburgei]|uniref:hypothetical protein n=1 Tax=Yokenella regensburgei TaxID=158877 RepID=UPI000241F72D|nr:hypothetical protein [Yokenella regensburgei]EHM46037.1 hypothetical protein HMPREF0880_04088 [Yokenella regensburgei ATCC 43003]
MSTITKERLQRLIRAIDSENFDEEEIVGWVNSDEIMELARIALAAMQQEPEWTNEQCLEFLSIAFRHAEIKGDLELDDIRLGVKMVNGSRAAMLQGKAEPVSNRDELPPDEIECDICGHVSTDPDGRHYCCEDNSND